jgi:hypothetical protein
MDMRRFRHAARIAGGYTLLVVGVIGLFLPVLQGVLLIIAGAAMLGWDLKKMRNARDRLISLVRRRTGRARPCAPASDGRRSPPAARSGTGGGEA